MNKKLHKMKILFNSEETEILIDENMSIIDNLSRHGIHVDNLCSGKGICGKCIIKIIDGEFSHPTFNEKKWLRIIGENIRLACQTRALSDCVIKIERLYNMSGAKILSWRPEKKVALKTRVVKKVIKLELPLIYDYKGDLERVIHASQCKTYDPLIIPKISEIINKSSNKLSIIEYENEIIEIVPDENNRVLGAAIDLGTTTIVLSLYDLITGILIDVESGYNQQLRFGEDVISRVEYARKNNNITELRNAVINTINDMLSKILKRNNLDDSFLYEIVCSGNTTMLSFLLGNDFYYSSKAPFIPPFTSSIKIKARDLGIKMNPKGYVKTVPSVSAYIGSDVVADILASNLHEFEGVGVLIDIGTNGEVVIKTREGKLIATSCAAGPALEGYGLKHGMRAVNGAIESVIIDETGKCYFKVIGDTKPAGICGTGVVEAIAWMWIRGFIDDSGRLTNKKCKWITKNAQISQYIVVPADETATLQPIVITQKDIRKVQLAKSAIFSALMTLLRITKTNLDEIERIYIAGAFGNYLNIFAAQVLGLLPDIPRERFFFIGNGSLAGAEMVLLSNEFNDLALQIRKVIEVIELNTIKSFQEEFIDATHIPHKDKKLFIKIINEVEPFRLKSYEA